MRQQRKLYEGTGSTLEVALADFPGTKELFSLENPHVEIRILQGETVVVSYEGTKYQQGLTRARQIAETNTRGDYKPSNPVYTTEVHVQGYYHQ